MTFEFPATQGKVLNIMRSYFMQGRNLAIAEGYAWEAKWNISVLHVSLSAARTDMQLNILCLKRINGNQRKRLLIPWFDGVIWILLNIDRSKRFIYPQTVSDWQTWKLFRWIWWQFHLNEVFLVDLVIFSWDIFRKFKFLHLAQFICVENQ